MFQQIAFGIFVAVIIAIAIEAFVTWRLGRSVYDVRDTETSLGIALGWLLVGLGSPIAGGLAAAAFAKFQFASIGQGVAGWIIAILLADLVFYFWHRLSHRLRWFWAAHSVHHTAGRMNILTAFRQSWLEVLSGVWFLWAPLALIGVSPAQIGAYYLLTLAWNPVIHLQWVGKLGPLEYVLNTPSRHRLHHSTNPALHNSNYGSLLIVWDLIFGTAKSEGEVRETEFGLPGYDPETMGPVRTVWWQWGEMIRDWRGQGPSQPAHTEAPQTDSTL